MEYSEACNIEHEPSGIAGVALFFQKKHLIPANAKIVIVNTGKLKLHNQQVIHEKNLQKIFDKLKKLKKEF